MQRRIGLLCLGLVWICSASLRAAELPEVKKYVDGMQNMPGFFAMYWDEDKGRLLLYVDRLDEDFLYLPSLATGLGSSRLLIDRGRIGDEKIARFQKTGPRIQLILQNPGFRATSGDDSVRRAVEESFPVSVVGSFEILARDDKGYLIDLSSFLTGDVLGLAPELERANQGTYRVDRERSSIYLPRTAAFPENTEIEVLLTLSGDRPGGLVRRHTPDARALSLRVHHSFVKLPDDQYEPRRFDPRIGYFPVVFYDYTRSFDEGYAVRYVSRHRLIKKDPAAPRSEPVEPIIYYLDPAIPEPYRSAFIEGASWWNRMFDAAGFINAFRIEPMPADMDPLDARYNVIQWVHRTEAGSSIGPSFVDPRTGEIIKAAVRMDSHRSLADYDIYAGAIPSLDDNSREWGGEPALPEAWVAQLDGSVTAEEFAMARRRQHAAHEVGHTLGLAHNFIAASYGRASVMDYPAPLLRIVEGRLDLSQAYRDGPGIYDELAIRYGYTQFPPGQERQALQNIVEEAIQSGALFITNSDERSTSSYPEATTWINGEDAVEDLQNVIEVRRHLIDHFDESAVREGEPLAILNRRFARVYLHHRFSLGAAIKAIGGMEFRYAVRGESPPPTSLVPARKQKRALQLLMASLEPEQLDVPEPVLRLLAPPPFGYGNEELAYESPAAPAFDHISLARTLATMILSGILEPERAARVVAFSERDPSLWTLEGLLDAMIEALWRQPRSTEGAPYRRVTQGVLVDELIDLAAHRKSTADVRAASEWALKEILEVIQGESADGPADEAHLGQTRAAIERFLRREVQAVPGPAAIDPPPGTPIGDAGRPIPRYF